MKSHKVERWKTLIREEVFSSPPWITVYKDKIQLPTGNIIPDYYSVDLPDYVIIFATNKKGQVLFERQYKHALNEISLCLPAGCIDPGETPLEAAKREFLEETGYISQQWTKQGEYFVDGNKGCSIAHFYFAQEIEKVAKPKQEDSELLDIVFLSRPEMLMEQKKGHIKVLATAAFIAIATNDYLI